MHEVTVTGTRTPWRRSSVICAFLSAPATKSAAATATRVVRTTATTT